MPHVDITACLPAADPDAVFAMIGDFGRYPELAAEIHDVQVRRVNPLDPTTVAAEWTLTSEWTVSFRNGLLCWTEQDRIDPVARTIDFEQLDGDFESFSGSWAVSAAEDGVQVRFRAEFDLGMPSLASMIDPIAERALRENIEAILNGLRQETPAPVC